MAKNKLQQESDKANKKLLSVSRLLIAEIKKQIESGKSTTEAIQKAWATVGIETKLTETILSSVEKSITLGLGSGVVSEAFVGKVSSFYLYKYIDESKTTLSERVYKNISENKKAIVDEIKSTMKKNESWTKAAKTIDDTKLVNGDIAEDIRDLVSKARAAMGGDAEAIANYKKTLSKAQRRVEGMASRAEPVSKLRKAYQAVIDATEKGSQKAIDKAIDKAVKAKVRYNSERLVRTEMSKSYGEAFHYRNKNNKFADGYRWVLSSAHPRTDECDFYANADLYGMGKGVYPKGEQVPYPAHPNCLCGLIDYVKES